MALTFNLPSQIVVQTAAQWAVDATVYSNKRILVTSDEYYGSTDQRKFKIADGTQTWANLDFMPISQTLAQVLANGNSTNGLSFDSPDSLTYLLVKNNNIDTVVDNNNTVSEINITPNTIVISTTGASIDLSATSVTKNSSEILTSANITQVITNGVTDKAPSEDAVYDALAGKSSVIAKQTTDTSHSGNTSNTIITNITIPANSMGANDIAFIEASFYKTGSTDTAIWAIYIGPNSNSLVGASSLGNSSNSATQLLSSWHRTIVNKNSQSINYAYQQTGGVENPWVNSTGARVAINQNFATQLYLMVAVQMNGTTDTGGVDWIYMTKQ